MPRNGKWIVGKFRYILLIKRKKTGFNNFQTLNDLPVLPVLLVLDIEKIEALSKMKDFFQRVY